MKVSFDISKGKPRHNKHNEEKNKRQNNMCKSPFIQNQTKPKKNKLLYMCVCTNKYRNVQKKRSGRIYAKLSVRVHLGREVGLRMKKPNLRIYFHLFLIGNSNA